MARVAGADITQGALERRIKTLEAEHSTPAGALRRSALEYLISSTWLSAEAASRNLVSRGEVERQLSTFAAAYPDGRSGLNEWLQATGRSVADLRHEAEAQLAAARLLEIAKQSAPLVTQSQIVAYYRRHMASFVTPERRYFDIDSLRSNAQAKQVKREVEAGRGFSGIALHEEVSNPPGAKDQLERAIFAARPDVLTGPIILKGIFHSVFSVTRIIPARQRSLADVRHGIVARLEAGQQRRALMRFVQAWRTRWIARTDCRPGFIVQKCRQYSGSKESEDPLALS